MDKLRHTIRRGHSAPIELLTSWAAAMWGAWLLLPLASFQGDSFDTLANIGPEPVWGLCVLAVGFFGVWALASDRLSERRRAMILVFGVWVFIAAARFCANVSNPAAVVDIVYAAGAAWAFLRLSAGR